MPKSTWRFAGFEFSRARGLSRDGIVIPLQAKPRALLELLLRAGGDLVTKDTIAAAVWGAEVPSDASLARAVRGLRKAFSSAEDIVQTVYGEGMRMACPVTMPENEAGLDRDVVGQLLRTAWEIAESRVQHGYTRAIETLRYAVQRFPDAAAAWALLADAHASRAIRNLVAPASAAADIHACCEKALLADPSCGQAIAVSGLALGLLQGHIEAGLKRLDSGLDEDSDWPTFYYRAWLQIGLRNLSGALIDVERALAFTPLNRSLLEMKAFITLYQGRIEEADAYARDMQKVRDDADGLWIVRSIAASEMGDHTRSCLHAERAATLMERNRQTSSYLAYAYARAGYKDRARKILTAIAPGVNGHTPALLAAPYLALGEPEEARRILAIASSECCPHRTVTWCDPRTKWL